MMTPAVPFAAPSSSPRSSGKAPAGSSSFQRGQPIPGMTPGFRRRSDTGPRVMAEARRGDLRLQHWFLCMRCRLSNTAQLPGVSAPGLSRDCAAGV